MIVTVFFFGFYLYGLDLILSYAAAYLTRLVQIVVPAKEADALFKHVHEAARIDRPGGGVILQTPLIAATPYELPEEPSPETT